MCRHSLDCSVHLADGGGVEAVVVVAVAGLDEDGAVGQTLGVHLAPHIVQVHAWTQGVVQQLHAGRVDVKCSYSIILAAMH